MIRLLGILVSLIIVATVAVAVTMDKKGEKKDMEETMTAKAIFAGGCFWCMEPPFEKLDGVHAVVSGYIDGHKENPTYQEVSSGTTGHTEAVEITYDPNKISFAELLEVFWMNIDPTDAGGQFVDRGSQYRTGIFYLGDEQKRLAFLDRIGRAVELDQGAVEPGVLVELQLALIALEHDLLAGNGVDLVGMQRELLPGEDGPLLLGLGLQLVAVQRDFPGDELDTLGGDANRALAHPEHDVLVRA